MKEKTFQLGIEDIVKPLVTKAKKFKVDIGELFDKYDTDKNQRLSAEELRNALKKNNISLSNDDVLILKDYFYNKYQRHEITKDQFFNLMKKTRFERKFDAAEAKQSLFSVRNKFD